MVDPLAIAAEKREGKQSGEMDTTEGCPPSAAVASL